jgi:hypothetical protein
MALVFFPFTNLCTFDSGMEKHTTNQQAKEGWYTNGFSYGNCIQENELGNRPNVKPSQKYKKKSKSTHSTL